MRPFAATSKNEQSGAAHHNTLLARLNEMEVQHKAALKVHQAHLMTIHEKLIDQHWLLASVAFGAAACIALGAVAVGLNAKPTRQWHRDPQLAINDDEMVSIVPR